MQTRIHPDLVDLPGIAQAEEIVRSCVHCGFCNATCPTYQELNDERDGPRGRIYLIRQLLEEGSAGEATRRHLDRCLTCRSCESTCPSGVQYARLADTGRRIVERQTTRPIAQRTARRILRWLVPWPRRFAPLLRLGQWLRPLLPRSLRGRVPRPQQPGPLPARRHDRHIILLGGCAQAVATPGTNAAATRVLDRIGISAVEPVGAGCCGALSYHLTEHDEARGFIRRNLDAWRPWLDSAEAVVSCSSGCGAMLQEYAHVMSDDPDYADLAREVSARTRDLSEVLASEDLSTLDVDTGGKTALHCPCTLTHTLKAQDTLRALLQSLGIRLATTREDHLCCGSAGTYSLLQPALSQRLLDRKLAALTGDDPARVVTANVGCQLHLGSKAGIPVQHWIELLDKREDR